MNSHPNSSPEQNVNDKVYDVDEPVTRVNRNSNYRNVTEICRNPLDNRDWKDEDNVANRKNKCRSS